MNKPKYEVMITKNEWAKTSKAQEMSGWLHYQCRDGTIGLARPGRWREVQVVQSNRKEGNER